MGSLVRAGRPVLVALALVLVAAACGEPQATVVSAGAARRVVEEPPATSVSPAATLPVPPTPTTAPPAPPPPPPYPDVCRAELPDHTVAPISGWAPSPQVEAGLSFVASAAGDEFTVHTRSGGRTFLNGVNLGVALPGSWPNDWSAGSRTYTAWIRQIGELGFRSIRTYTLHPAAFYDALAAHNTRHPDAAIYLMQGIWFPEDQFAVSGDLFDAELGATVAAEIAGTVAALAGDLDRRDIPPFGRYEADVTPWLAGIIFGVEWDPQLLAASEELNTTVARRPGRYISATPDSSSTEVWLADQLDAIAFELAARDVAAPIAFLNWPATDPLSHPTAVGPMADVASLDANHLRVQETWPAGLFAAYHAYPYAPPFLETEPGIADFMRNGDIDPFAGYLTKLRTHHPNMPVILAEVGVPTGWISAGGLDPVRQYGGLLEAAQMTTNAELVETASDVGLDGAMLFSWMDEWFKATWNTAALEVPDAGRARWHNLLSPEQHFGVLAVEPDPPARLDGTVGDWSADEQISEPGSAVALSAAHDAGAVYLMAQGRLPDTFEIRIDTSGSVTHWEDPVEPYGDVAIRVSGTSAEIVERSPYEAATVLASDGEPQLAVTGDVGVWEPYELLRRFASSRSSAQIETLSRLRRSVDDGAGTIPAAEAAWARTRNVFEVRIPWALLSMGDPSSGTALRFTRGQTAGVQRSFDIRVVGEEVVASGTFEWEPWDEPLFRQRLKSGHGILAGGLCRTAFD